jgi:hypothetical protein
MISSLQGGPSHIDLFDRWNEQAGGRNFTGDIKYDNAAESTPSCSARGSSRVK